jgi:hypothetical protein
MKPEDLARSGSEFGEQGALFCWANLAETRRRFPHFYNAETKRCKLYATNQNFTDAVKGARAKQIGIQAGVADIFLPLPRHGCAGLYIELKRDPTHPQNQRTGKRGKAIKAKSGATSEAQEAFGRQVRADGYGWAVAHGWREAVAILERYLTE